jgi:hypothetical protein
VQKWISNAPTKKDLDKASDDEVGGWLDTYVVKHDYDMCV